MDMRAIGFRLFDFGYFASRIALASSTEVTESGFLLRGKLWENMDADRR